MIGCLRPPDSILCFRGVPSYPAASSRLRAVRRTQVSVPFPTESSRNAPVPPPPPPTPDSATLSISYLGHRVPIRTVKLSKLSTVWRTQPSIPSAKLSRNDPSPPPPPDLTNCSISPPGRQTYIRTRYFLRAPANLKELCTESTR